MVVTRYHGIVAFSHFILKIVKEKYYDWRAKINVIERMTNRRILLYINIYFYTHFFDATNYVFLRILATTATSNGEREKKTFKKREKHCDVTRTTRRNC